MTQKEQSNMTPVTLVPYEDKSGLEYVIPTALFKEFERQRNKLRELKELCIKFYVFSSTEESEMIRVEYLKTEAMFEYTWSMYFYNPEEEPPIISTLYMKLDDVVES
jgi:hypothetical protein